MRLVVGQHLRKRGRHCRRVLVVLLFLVAVGIVTQAKAKEGLVGLAVVGIVGRGGGECGVVGLDVSGPGLTCSVRAELTLS